MTLHIQYCSLASFFDHRNTKITLAIQAIRIPEPGEIIDWGKFYEEEADVYDPTSLELTHADVLNPTRTCTCEQLKTFKTSGVKALLLAVGTRDLSTMNEVAPGWHRFAMLLDALEKVLKDGAAWSSGRCQ